jgi:heme exporter protein D
VVIFLAFAFDIGCYIYLVVTLRRRSVGDINMKSDAIDASLKRRMLLFILGFSIAWLGAVINRLYEINHPPNYILESWEAYTIPLQGLLNAMVYGINPRSKQILKDLYRKTKRQIKIWCCRYQETTIKEEEDEEAEEEERVNLVTPVNLPKPKISFSAL